MFFYPLKALDAGEPIYTGLSYFSGHLNRSEVVWFLNVVLSFMFKRSRCINLITLSLFSAAFAYA